jgi:hypothetical protein
MKKTDTGSRQMSPQEVSREAGGSGDSTPGTSDQDQEIFQGSTMNG